MFETDEHHVLLSLRHKVDVPETVVLVVDRGIIEFLQHLDRK